MLNQEIAVVRMINRCYCQSKCVRNDIYISLAEIF